MRLWHIDLINKLPRQQLLGQWRECIALLGNGWGKRHKTVDYVFKNPEYKLVYFSKCVSNEMIFRGYKPNTDLIYKALNKRHTQNDTIKILNKSISSQRYNEHNDKYLQECLDNLKEKGIII